MERDSQSLDSSCRICLFATRSEADVRNEESESFMRANLIVHQCMPNIFHKTVEPLSIVGVVGEVRGIVSGCYRVHSPAGLS